MNISVLKPEIYSDIESVIEQSGLNAVLRIDQPNAWQIAWANLEAQSVAYAASMIDYQHAYMRNSGVSLVDISMVLLNDGKPCGIWPLTLSLGELAKLSSHIYPILPPVFTLNLSSRTVKKITSSALRFINNFQKKLSQSVINSQESVVPNSLILGLSEWHQQLLSAGASVSVKHDLYVDLAPSMDNIRLGFRKSYRPLISVGLKTWKIEVMDVSNANVFIWQEFKLLHQKAAGRVTRSDETWNLQYQMILCNEGMLIHLHDCASQNKMVGAGFFQFTRDEGLYAVGAYDRELFDKPIGHVVQQRAIEIMKKLNLRWYQIGERFYPSDNPKPTEKELSIALFKQGFASYILPRFIFELSGDNI